mmetsp:Transcript_14559/g.39899  ORF Transcript_14559/g.39899 Transcript_14559/m.39899 type:complete len:316 (+) Transcript_14559:20-967(+)
MDIITTNGPATTVRHHSHVRLSYTPRALRPCLAPHHHTSLRQRDRERAVGPTSGSVPAGQHARQRHVRGGSGHLDGPITRDAHDQRPARGGAAGRHRASPDHALRRAFISWAAHLLPLAGSRRRRHRRRGGGAHRRRLHQHVLPSDGGPHVRSRARERRGEDREAGAQSRRQHPRIRQARRHLRNRHRRRGHRRGQGEGSHAKAKAPGSQRPGARPRRAARETERDGQRSARDAERERPDAQARGGGHREGRDGYMEHGELRGWGIVRKERCIGSRPGGAAAVRGDGPIGGRRRRGWRGDEDDRGGGGEHERIFE